jgi:GNAT superfamily N-acetyltransferase
MVTVRPAERSDADAAIAVVHRSIAELCTADHRNDAETLAGWLANKTVPHFVAWLANEDNHCVVAEAGGRLVGVGLLRRDGEILLFFLSPEAQRRGIGTAVHAALEEQAAGWGLPKLTLDSTFAARPFYERLGYRSTGAARPRFGVLQSYPYEKTLQP